MVGFHFARGTQVKTGISYIYMRQIVFDSVLYTRVCAPMPSILDAVLHRVGFIVGASAGVLVGHTEEGMSGVKNTAVLLISPSPYAVCA